MGNIFLQRIIRGKTVVWVGLNAMFADIYLSSVRDFAFQVSEKTRPLFLPFLLSDIYFLSIFMLSILYFYSDIPFFERHEMYKMIRMGRTRWNICNMVYILFCGFFLWFAEFVMSVILLLPNVSFGKGWGRILGTLAMTDAGIQTKQMMDISYGTLVYYKPSEFLLISWLLSGLAIAVVGMCMYVTSLCLGKMYSAVVGSVLVILPGIASYLFDTPLNYFSPISWMRVGIFHSGQIMRMPTMKYMLIVLSTVLLILFILSTLRLKKMDICWTEDN